jgi:DNA-binding transcriptional ArsR family regulator
VPPSSTKDAQADADQLDRIFRALGDRTRRAMLQRLATGPATVSELAEPFDITLAGASKHLKVLEHAGLATRTVEGRVRRCTLTAQPLHAASTWIAAYRPFWESALDSLAEYMQTQPRQPKP